MAEISDSVERGGDRTDCCEDDSVVTAEPTGGVHFTLVEITPQGTIYEVRLPGLLYNIRRVESGMRNVRFAS